MAGGGVAVVHIIHSVISNNKNNSRQCRLQRQGQRWSWSRPVQGGGLNGSSGGLREWGRRGLPAQCRQLETHYALTADCGQTSYSLCLCLPPPSSSPSSFLYIHLNIFLYTYFFCFVLRAYFAFSFSHASLCRSSLPYCLVLHSFIVSFFQPASRCVARFLFFSFSFFPF